MSRIAFCARLGRRPELREISAHLRSLGHEVVSSWVFEDSRDEELTDAQKMAAALRNYNDTSRANVVVLFGEKPGTPGSERGGRHSDFGATFHVSSTITRIIVGPRENINCYWPGVVHVKDASALIEMLTQKKGANQP